MDLLHPLEWDWPVIGDQYLKPIANALVGAGLGTGIIQMLRDRRARRSHAAYMAMRLAITLEFYASACSDLISANENAQTPPDEEYPAWDTGLPALPLYPDDAEGWRSIDRRLAGRCLNLRNKIDGSQGLIRSTIEFSEDYLGDTITLQAAERGKEAWDLAVALRRKHRIERADTVWDYADHLGRSIHSANRSMKEQNSRSAGLLASMAAVQHEDKPTA